MKPTLYVQGMHGLGDNLHQRAVLRQLAERYRIILETSWPAIYHDLAGPDFMFARRRVGLRTQSKNAEREDAKFSAVRHGLGMQTLRIAYSGSQVLRAPSGTILEVMCQNTGTDFLQADFRLPVPDAWSAKLFKALGPLPTGAMDKPWMVYRPLVSRSEWPGGTARNADPLIYHELFSSIRDRFFVISVADIDPPHEVLCGVDAKADLTFHGGELDFEALAALIKGADLVFTSSGFGAILAPAVETPVISIIGGYETRGCHAAGERFAPMLSIGPEPGCSCWTSACRRLCSKAINTEAAHAAIGEFIGGAVQW